MFIPDPIKLINRILFLFLVISIIFAGFTITFWQLVRGNWDNATNQTKIKNLEEKVQALTATTTIQLNNLRSERSFFIRKK